MAENSKERLDELMKALGLTQSEFADKIGVGINAVTNWKSRGIKGSSFEKIVAAFPSVNVVWLLTGDGQMFTDNSPSMRPHIPVTASAGGLVGFADVIKAGDCDMLPVIPMLPSYDYTIAVKGNSMEPKYEGGDIIAIRKVHDFIEWGKTYVLDTADGAVIKRLYDNGESYRCVSFNKEYQDFLVDKSAVFGVYQVVGLIRV